MALSVDIEKNLGTFRLKVSFEAGNEVLALLGASGCGKSMTLKCIAGIEKPDKGHIILDGKTLFDSDKNINISPQKRNVGYLFQQYALFPNMTVEQNISCGVKDKKQKNAMVSEIIRVMHLEGTENKRPHQLSGGQQQRVALARILVNEPEVLLLDEPFSALDSHLRFQLERQVRQVIRHFGKTVILVSHDRDEVFRLSDSIATMGSGMIETIGPKHEVFRSPGTTDGAILTGCKNISRAKRIDDTHIHALDWNITLTVPEGQGTIDNVGIRMHDVRIGDGENAVACQVTEVIENPFSYTVMLEPPGAETPLGIELSKAQWEAIRAETLTVMLPINSILLLKEENNE